jgi:NAD(P)-dependent dehydrogenase (short-subunit alcohol dehydrogenase family)
VANDVRGRFRGKTALVTGGGWNIGRAIAERLAAEGAAVAICGRRRELLDETAEAIRAAGGRALAMEADVTDLARMEQVAARVGEELGPIDAVCAIAGGGGGYEAIDAIDPHWWEHVIRINLVGTFHAARVALPAMRARNAGTIVTCSGGGAYFPMLGVHATAYAAAKAGICRFTDQLAAELLDTRIRVNCLQPGLVWSPDRLEQIEAEEARTGRPHRDREHNHAPEEAAELALFLSSDASAPLTGRLVSVDDDWWRDPEKVRAVCESPHLYCLRRMELP